MRTVKENAAPEEAREQQGPQHGAGEGTLGIEIMLCCRKEHYLQYQYTCKMSSEILHLIPSYPVTVSSPAF